MQDQVNNGGPAFPVSENYDERRGEPITYASEGMSLRDYFAAAALQGWLASWPESGVHNIESTKKLASSCYAIADAMLKERSK